MQNTTNNRRKKRLGAAACALIFAVGMLFLLICVMVDVIRDEESWSLVFCVVITALVLLALIVGVLIALCQRWKEIEKGEEDDAQIY